MQFTHLAIPFQNSSCKMEISTEIITMLHFHLSTEKRKKNSVIEYVKRFFMKNCLEL